MFSMTLICMGKLKEKFYISAAEEYRKRLGAFCSFQLLELPEYKAATLVLTYVSTAIEVDTLELIRRALAEGKRVAVPYCIPGKIDMLFCEIFSLDDLTPGSFGRSHGICSVRRIVYAHGLFRRIYLFRVAHRQFYVRRHS